MKPLIVFLLISLIIPVAFSSKVYVWVDNSGNTQFTDYPPPPNAQTPENAQTPPKELDSQTLSETNVMERGIQNQQSTEVVAPPPNHKQIPPVYSPSSPISSYELFKTKLERENCPFLKRGSHEWSDCRAVVKTHYREICRTGVSDEKRKLENDLRQAYCALADYMTIIE